MQNPFSLIFGQEPYEEVLDEFDAYLEEYVYEKIWSELSGKDK